MTRFLRTLALLLLVPTLAHAQSAVQQAGPVVPGHGLVWFQNGVVGDAGTPAAPNLSYLGLYNGAACPFGISSQTNLGAATSPYGSFSVCQTLTTTTLNVSGMDGASPTSLVLDLNGANYTFPFPPGGPAGGDLGGSYPNPTVVSVGHVTTGILPVLNGGTGASVAATALSNLGGVGHTGSVTAGHCLTWASSFIVQDSGGNCGGAGTITSITFSSPLTGGTITSSGTVGLGTVTVPNGGTGLTTLTSGQALIGNGTSAVTQGTLGVAAGGTGDTTFTANAPLIGNGTSAVALGARSGNTITFATSNGALTSTHCVSIDASGNFVDAGGPCTTGGGGGTVTSATANQLAYYASSGTVVGGLASGDSGVLITSGSGVPSISTTLPSGLTVPSPALTTSPTTPTQTTSDNSTLIASDAYVQNNLANYAPLASPTLTGTPLAPTASSCTFSTQIATTAFVDNCFALIGGPSQVSESANYTFVLADAGVEYLHPSSDTTARTWTIPANASVAYPVGTKIEIVNDSSAGSISLVITSDTLEWFSATISTGTRTLPAGTIATLTKVTSTKWVLAGAGPIT